MLLLLGLTLASALVAKERWPELGSFLSPGILPVVFGHSSILLIVASGLLVEPTLSHHRVALRRFLASCLAWLYSYLSFVLVASHLVPDDFLFVFHGRCFLHPCSSLVIWMLFL